VVGGGICGDSDDRLDGVGKIVSVRVGHADTLLEDLRQAQRRVDSPAGVSIEMNDQKTAQQNSGGDEAKLAAHYPLQGLSFNFSIQYVSHYGAIALKRKDELGSTLICLILNPTAVSGE